MNKNRLENFSDGVFAIAVTLLILNVHVPDTKGITNSKLDQTVLGLIPHVLTFAFSFLVIGAFWVAHHRIFGFVKVLDRTLLWLNIVYLLFIAVIPLTAAILSENPFLPTAILIYTATLLIIAMMHFVLLEYMLRNEPLKHEVLTPEVYRSAQHNAVVGPVCYLIAALGSFINVYISFTAIIAAMVFYIFFSGRGKMEERLINAARKEST